MLPQRSLVLRKGEKTNDVSSAAGASAFCGKVQRGLVEGVFQTCKATLLPILAAAFGDWGFCSPIRAAASGNRAVWRRVVHTVHGGGARKRAGGKSRGTPLPAKNLPSHHPSFYFIITRGEKPDQQAFHPFDFQESTEPPSCKKRFPITSATFLSI